MVMKCGIMGKISHVSQDTEGQKFAFYPNVKIFKFWFSSKPNYFCKFLSFQITKLFTCFWLHHELFFLLFEASFLIKFNF